jgi:hypothetical protein
MIAVTQMEVTEGNIAIYLGIYGYDHEDIEMSVVIGGAGRQAGRQGGPSIKEGLHAYSPLHYKEGLLYTTWRNERKLTQIHSDKAKIL